MSWSRSSPNSAPLPDAPPPVDAPPSGGSASTASGIVVSWIASTGNAAQSLVLRGTTPRAITHPGRAVCLANTSLPDPPPLPHRHPPE